MIFSITYNKPTNTTTIVYNGEFSFKGKPEFSFQYDDLFVDDVRASKTIQATTYKLTKEQYNEVFKYVREFDYTELRQVFPYNDIGLYIGHSLSYKDAFAKNYQFLEHPPVDTLSKCVNGVWERVFYVMYVRYDTVPPEGFGFSIYDELYPTSFKLTPIEIYSESDMPHDLPIVSKESFWNGKTFDKIICTAMENDVIKPGFNLMGKVFFTEKSLATRTDTIKPYIENNIVKPDGIMYSFNEDKFYDSRSLDVLKDNKLTEIAHEYNMIMWNMLGYRLSSEEQMTFLEQYKDACQYLSDIYTPTPVIDNYMHVNNIPEEDKGDVVAKIINDYLKYQTISTLTMAKLEQTKKEIAALSTLEEFDEWVFVVPVIDIPDASVDTIIRNKKIMIKSIADSILSQLEFEYPEIEKKLWESQYKEAQQVIDSGLPENLNDIPCLYGLVKHRDTLPAETIEGRIAILAERVLINQWVWVKGASELCSQRQRYDDLITYNIEVMEQDEFLHWLAELTVDYEIPDILALYQEAAEYWQNRIYVAQNKVANKSK